MTKTNLIIIWTIIFLEFIANSKSYAQDFYQTYKSEFLDPLQKVQSTPDKEDDKLFFQEQVKKINNYSPAGLQRFIAKQIVKLTDEDPVLNKECIDAGLVLTRKNWMRGKEKIELLKKLSKIAENYQTFLKYDKKREKIELYKTAFLIEQDILDECIAMLDADEAKLFLTRWEQASDKVRDPKINSSLDQDKIKYRAKINNIKKFNTTFTNFKTQENSPTYKKAMAIDCLIYFFSPESALSFIDSAHQAEETKMLLAFSKYLNKQTKMAGAPYYISERDLTLPPPLLLERLIRIKDIQNAAQFAKERFEKDDYTFYHYARDLSREVMRKYMDDQPFDEKALTSFFVWADNILKDEQDETQLAFLYQIKPKLAEARAEIQDAQCQTQLTKIETSINDKINQLEKKLKIIKYRIPAPGEETENEKEKQWLAKPQHERNRIIELLQEKVRKANSNSDRVNFWVDPINLSLNISNESDFENFAPLKEIPFKSVNINHCTNIADLSFLKDSPVVTIDASWSNLKNISALRGMKSLRNLNLAGTQIIDLTDLKGLNITNLYINHTKIKDLTPLKMMPLTELSIEHTAISSLSPLEYMPLNNLNANECRFLKDIEALDNTDLKILRMNGCENIRSLEPLSRLTLRELYIEETLVNDLSPITKSNLTHFSFTKCPNIKSINEIGIMNIEHLGINNQQFIATIIKFEFNLRYLRVAGSNIQDLSPIKYFEQLDTLDISDCDTIKDLRTLKNPSLNNLIANNCKQLRTFAGISELNIKNLYANESEIRELSSLQNSKVEKIEMRNSELTVLKGVHQIPQIRELDIRDCKKLRDISDVEKTNIEMFWLNGTKPQSFEPIKKMQRCRFCDVNP